MQHKISEEAKDLGGNMKRYCKKYKINKNQADINYIKDQIANVKGLIKNQKKYNNKLIEFKYKATYL